MTKRKTVATSKNDDVQQVSECTKRLLPVSDVLELTSGKWRLHIVMALMVLGPRRFN